MSRFGGSKGRKLPGAEFSWETEPGGEADTAPTPLFPKYAVPRARPLNPREQKQVDFYRALRERFHDGPYYSVLQSASRSARKDDPSRAHFDPFHGMPTYSGKYQKQKRDRPELKGRPYVMKFFPRHLWKTIQPNFNPTVAMDGYVPVGPRSAIKRGFEDDEEEEDVEDTKRRKGEEEEEGAENEDEEQRDILEGDEEQEEEIVDDDFEDDEDEMGGDYNAEQYFDGGDDEYGDDGFADGGGGGGGDEDTY